MTRLLNAILICTGILLQYTQLQAAALPADSLIDSYVNGLQAAIHQKIKANSTAAARDYLLIYDDEKEKFITDYVNNGEYFWFARNSNQETELRKLTNSVQELTGGQQLYVVLASIYNYAGPSEIKDIDWAEIKKSGKYQAAPAASYKGLWSMVIPKVRQKAGLSTDQSILYIISYFTCENGIYKVSHKGFYNGSTSLRDNGFQMDATDFVTQSHSTANDLASMRVSFLKKTIQAAASSIGQFNTELQKVNELFAKLPEGSLGRNFYNDYTGYCKDELVLKKLALLISEMGYESYTAYLSDKKNTSDSYASVVFRSFYEHLKQFNDTYKNISKLLPDIKTPGNLVKTLNQLTSSELGVLKYPERLKAIQLLNKLKELTDNSWWQLLNTNRWVNVVRDDDNNGKIIVKSEELMVALVSSTPASQRPLLVTDLKGKDGKYQLLKDIIYKIDDAPVGEDNYSALVQHLASMVVSSATDSALEVLYETNRIFSWDEGKMHNILDDASGMQRPTITINNEIFSLTPYSTEYEYKPEFDNEMGVSLMRYRITRQYETMQGGYLMPKRCSTCVDIRPVGRDALEPFDLVAIIPSGSISFNTGFSIEPDQITLLPAFFLEWYLYKKRNQEIKTGINLTLAAVSTVTGVGAIVNGASWTVRILAAAETAFTLTAVAGEEYPGFNTFMKDNLGTTGYQVFKTVEFGVNVFSAGKGLAGLGKGAYNTAKKLSTAFLDLVKNKPDFLAKLKQAYPERFKRLAAWMKDKDLGGTDLAAIAARGGSQYKGLDFMKDYKIVLDVSEETAAYRASRFKGTDDVWSDPDASFLETGPPAGGGGGAVTAVIRETRNATARLEYGQDLAKQLAEKQLLQVADKAMSYAELTEFTANSVNLLQTAQIPQKAATLKVMQNIARTSKVVLLEMEEASYVLYAQGEAKTLVETYIQAKQKEKEKDKCKLCEAEPLICTLEKKATYGNKTQALSKLCAQVPALQLKPVCVKLNSLDVSELNTFLGDVMNNKPAGVSCTGSYTYLAQNIPSLTPELIAAWEIFEEAGRSCLRVSTGHLDKLKTAMQNRRLRNAPYSITDDNFVKVAKACASQGAQTAIVDDEIFVNLDAFANRSFTVSSFAEMLSNLQNGNGYYTVTGANWVLRYMQKHAAEFTGSIRFEEVTIFDDTEKRIADVVMSNPDGPVYYEFKSYATASLPPSGFMEQFTKDMMRITVNSMDQVKWIFDGSKTTRNDVYLKLKKELKDHKSMLRNDKIIRLFDALAEDVGYGKDILTVDHLLKFIDENGQWFDHIFKVTQ